MVLFVMQVRMEEDWMHGRTDDEEGVERGSLCGSSTNSVMRHEDIEFLTTDASLWCVLR